MKNLLLKYRHDLAAVVLLVAAVPLGWSYFSVKDSFKILENECFQFIEDASPGWLRITPSELENATSDRPPSFETLVLRTAMKRWHSRNFAPGAFDWLMRFQAGSLGAMPTGSEWEILLTNIDDKWRASRRQALAAGGFQGRTEVVAVDQHGLEIRFYGIARTGDMGSVIRLTMESPVGAQPSAAPALYWSTVLSPGFSPNKRRLGLITMLPAASASHSFTVEFDMSAEPQWINPQTAIGSLRIAAQNAGTWKLTRMQFGDSPSLLP